MKALIINSFGGPEVLKQEELAIPKPGRGEVLMRVHAAGINPVDYKIRNGSMKMVLGKKFPKVLGFDVAGVVEQASKKSRFQPGDRVFAMLPFKGGGYAEFVTVREDNLSHIPEGTTMKEAAATPLAALTALQAFRKGGGISEGDRVLVNGASGGVGSFAVQIAKAMGAEVTAVCSTRNIDFVDSLGADKVIDYTSEDFTRLKTRFHVVFDAVAKSSFRKCRRILARQGDYVTTVPNKGLLWHKTFNFTRKKKADFILVKPSGDDLETIADMMARGLIKPYVQQSFLLSEGSAAHEMIETERVRGKIVFHLV